ARGCGRPDNGRGCATGARWGCGTVHPAEGSMRIGAGTATIGTARSSAIRAALLLMLSGNASALAQTQPDGARSGHGAEQVIISSAPEHTSRIHALLSRLFGKPKTERLGTTGSEVVSIPKSKVELLEKRLKQAGAKITRLRENWNHILTKRKEDVPLSPEQKAAVAKASNAPEVTRVGVLQMPDAAIAELALTRFERQVGPKGRAGPQDDPYAKVVLPLGDGLIRLVRARPPDFTPGGVTWVGETEETAERAVLMLWKDGHLSGYFGYKGRVYTVNHVGGEVHTMAEIDPKKLPPDHAPDPAQRNPSVTPAPPTQEPEVPPFRDADRQALEAKTIVIDVMLLYTPKEVAEYIRNPVDLSSLAIEQANQTLRNSGLGNVSLRLVDSQLIDYDEAGADQFEHLYRMVDGVGPFKDLKRLRDEKRADIVGLV